MFEVRSVSVGGKKFICEVVMKPKYKKLMGIAKRTKSWRIKKKNLLRVANAMGYVVDRGGE